MSWMSKLGGLVSNLFGRDKPNEERTRRGRPTETVHEYALRMRVPSTWFTKKRTRGIFRSMRLAWETMSPVEKAWCQEKGWVSTYERARLDDEVRRRRAAETARERSTV